MSDLKRGSLSCAIPYKSGSYIGAYSFTEKNPISPSDNGDKIELAYYYDADDCSEGAIIGPVKGLFPIGKKTWSDLIELEPPTGNDNSVEAIVPITKDKEGYAFWVKAKNNTFILVKIKTVKPASFSDITLGIIPTLEFEWTLPPSHN